MLPWWLVVSQRKERRWLGRSAEWCAECERLTVWDIESSEEVLRVWFIPVQRTPDEFDVATCLKCGLSEARDRAERDRLVMDRGVGLDELLSTVSDATLVRLDEREAAWTRIEAGSETSADRVLWLETALTRLAIRYQHWHARSVRDWWVGVAAGMIPVCGALGAGMGHALTPNPGSPLAPMYSIPAMLIGVVFGCVVTWVVHTTAPKRYLRRQWRGWFAKRLGRIRLESTELSEAWAALAEQGFAVAKRFTVSRILAWHARDPHGGCELADER